MIPRRPTLDVAARFGATMFFSIDGFSRFGCYRIAPMSLAWPSPPPTVCLGAGTGAARSSPQAGAGGAAALTIAGDVTQPLKERRQWH
jgi:hypothetical protein